MSIYDFDNEVVAEQLTPPALRTTKMLAWLKVITRPIGWLWSLIFEDYSDGAIYGSWSGFASHPVGERVTWTDKSNYECIEANGGFTGMEPSGGAYSERYWIKIQDNFIGVNQRIRFNAQIIILEHALNKWYRVDVLDPQIYIGNNVPGNGMLMGEADGVYSSKLPASSVFTTFYMGYTYDSAPINYTIYVPAALFATLGNNLTNRENNIKNFVNKYNLSGINYTITTY